MNPPGSLRILHLDDGREWRGVQQQIAFLLQQQVRAGHRPVLLCPGDVPLARWAAEQGLDVHEAGFQAASRARATTEVRDAVSLAVPDVVHAHTSRTYAAMKEQLGVEPSRPLQVVSCQPAWLSSPSPVGRGKDGGAVDLFVAVSHALRRDLVVHGVDPERVIVAAPAIDPLRHARPLARREALTACGLPAEARLIGNPCSLARRQRQKDLVDAFALLAPTDPHLHLVFLGEGPLREEIESRISELGLAGRVHLPGLRADAGNLMPHWDVAALPSLDEGTACPVLDALVAGVPVVATPTGDTAEVLGQGAGRLVPFRAPARLAVALSWMLEHPSASRAMALEGRRRVLAGYVPEVMAAAVEAGYRHALVRRQGVQGEGPGRERRGRMLVWGRDRSVRHDLLKMAESTDLPGAAGSRMHSGSTGRGAVVRRTVGGVAAVMKRQRRGGLPGTLAALLPGDLGGLFTGTARGSRGTTVAQHFRARGGEAPAPLGWLAVRHGLLYALYAAAEEIAGAMTVDQALERVGKSGRRALLTALGQALCRWHHAGLAHGDLNAGNILLPEAAGEQEALADRLVVIDLDSARMRRQLSIAHRAGALSRLERSLLKLHGPQALNRQERLRVLAAYGQEWALLEKRPPAEAAQLARRLLPALIRRRRLYRCHGIRL